MILVARIGEIETMCDTEDPAFVPDVAASLLAVLVVGTLKMWGAMPDAPTEPAADPVPEATDETGT